MSRALLTIILLSFSSPAFAYFQMDMLKSKKANVQAKQWTLADWLTQKNKQSLADHWLALHSSSNWFEMLLNGASEEYKLKTANAGTTTTLNQHGQIYRADAFLAIFNLGGEFEKLGDRKEAEVGAAGVRLLGASAQTTNLVLRGGLRKVSDFSAQEHWQNPFAEGDLKLYVFSFFGLSGGDRYYFAGTSNLANKYSGSRWNGGAFFDLSILRLGVDYFSESLKENASETLQRQGLEFGATIIF